MVVPAKWGNLEQLLAHITAFELGRGDWRVAKVCYGGNIWLWRHATLKMAFRTLASICASRKGSIGSCGANAAFAVGPNGEWYSYCDLKGLLA